MLTSFKCKHYPTIGSTNDELKTLVRCGQAEEGLVIWADQQTCGRGRHGKKWEGSVGNLYTSFLTQPKCSLKKTGELSFVAAVSIGQTLEALLNPAYEIKYKWPNDIMIAHKKVAGILLEIEEETLENRHWLIIGIGLNVNKAPQNLDYPAIALHEISTTYYTPYQLLERILINWQRNLKIWHAEGFEQIRLLWEEKALGKGDVIHINRGKEQTVGLFQGLDSQGSLILETFHQGVLFISSGEIFFGG